MGLVKLIAVIVGVFFLCMSLVALGVAYDHSSAKVKVLEAQLIEVQSNAVKAERDAYIAGIETCSADDRSTFHDAAESARVRMDKTDNPFKYLMYRYMWNTLTEWSDTWGYTDETLQSLSDEYMGTVGVYQ